MNPLEPGAEVDGFIVGECLHQSASSCHYRVRHGSDDADPGFALVMKVPTAADGDAQRIVHFEVEQQTLPLLGGSHVPRFVAVGDLAHQPYLVTELIEGRTLAQWLERPERADVDEVVRLGLAMADAVHSLHQQNAVHLGLEPAHVLVREDGRVVLLDFGLAWHAHLPDLLAGRQRRAIGSPAWMAPEQVAGVRGDPRSDIFAIGVILYQLLTGKLPFGAPETLRGLRRRLWVDPVPPLRDRPLLPPWLQEVVLRCLAPEPAQRYPSAAHLAFDLTHPQQVPLTERSTATRGGGPWAHFRRWVRAARPQGQALALPQRLIAEVPIVMVAVPLEEGGDAMLHALREAAACALGTRPGARLAAVTVISPEHDGGGAPHAGGAHHDPHEPRHSLMRLRHWAQALAQAGKHVSFHVLASADVAPALLDFARDHRVSGIILGAVAQDAADPHRLATVSARVAMEAPCTVTLVRVASGGPPPGQMEGEATD